jgi:hypothetical protein
MYRHAQQVQGGNRHGDPNLQGAIVEVNSLRVHALVISSRSIRIDEELGQSIGVMTLACNTFCFLYLCLKSARA